jgi:hypothetical protein
MSVPKAKICSHFLFLILITLVSFSSARQFGTFASGGALSANAAKYDVKYYELNLKVDPARQHLSGYVDVVVESAVPAMDTLELDLVNFYTISKTEREGKALPFTHRDHKIKLALAEKLPAGDRASFRIHYAGNPPVATRPPWEGGFNWSKDANGKPWIGVSCQGEAAKFGGPAKIIRATSRIASASTSRFRTRCIAPPTVCWKQSLRLRKAGRPSVGKRVIR